MTADVLDRCPCCDAPGLVSHCLGEPLDAVRKCDLFRCPSCSTYGTKDGRRFYTPPR